MLSRMSSAIDSLPDPCGCAIYRRDVRHDFVAMLHRSRSVRSRVSRFNCFCRFSRLEADEGSEKVIHGRMLREIFQQPNRLPDWRGVDLGECVAGARCDLAVDTRPV
jgi:hypothetical protein